MYNGINEIKSKVSVIEEEIMRLNNQKKLLLKKITDLQDDGENNNTEVSNIDFITPPDHINFYAKKMFGNSGKILDGSIAYIYENGGGPLKNHVHKSHDHLFIVVEGEAKIILENEEIILNKNESFLVNGSIPHSVWNNIKGKTIMIGLTIEN
ncbi:MAG: cupin domain-containing protein [Clostridium sp.]